MTRKIAILWIVVKRVLIALYNRQATGSHDGAPKFCLMEDTLELEMLSGVIIASGFAGREEEYVGGVMKYLVNSKYFLVSLLSLDS